MRDLVHALHEAAAVRDPGLWEPQLALALWTAEAKGPKDAIARMEELATRQPQVPGVLGALARGERPSAIAKRYEVSRVWVYQVKARLLEAGEVVSLDVV